MSKTQVEMYWDAGSTNTYFALKLIKPILEKHNAELVLHPYNVGYVFRNNSYELMKEPKAKLRNRKADLMRWAAKYNLPFQIPRQFPIKSSRILRGSVAMRQKKLELQFVERVFDAYWQEGNAGVAEYEGLRPIVAALGVDPDWFEATAASDETAAEVARSTDAGIERGVFGVPSIFVEEEMFWGKDRMEFVDDELARIAARSTQGGEQHA